MLYPDTSFIFPLYVSQIYSETARGILSVSGTSCVLSRLNLFEFRQAVRLQVFRHHHHRQEGFSEKQGDVVLRTFSENIANGVFQILSIDYDELLAEAERLSARHTQNRGYRSFDVLHVAAALHLRADALLTFDQDQRELAAAANLPTLPAKLPRSELPPK